MDQAEMQEALAVRDALRAFKRAANEIMDEIGERKRFDRDEVEDLQAKLKALKTGLQAAAKYGTLSGRNEPLSEMERFFYAPTVQSASANFRLAVNANPNTTDWVGALYGTNLDLSHLLHQLEGLIAKQRGDGSHG